MNSFPYLRLGRGPEPLLMLPGLAIDNEPPTAVDARLYAWSMRRLAARSVIVLRRPREIAKAVPHGLSTADIADLDSPAGTSRS